jgi:hypothetical protein
MNFDAPDRSACTVKRPRSNTPLQALTLQNDPAYVEMAEALADRITSDWAGRELDDQLTTAFRTVVTRRPTSTELSTLKMTFEQARERYAADPKSTRRIVGKREFATATAAADWATWFNIAQVLLNLDETITKP